MKTAFERLALQLFLFLAFLCAASDGFGQGDGNRLGVGIREAQEAGVPATALNGVLSLGYEKRLEPTTMVTLVGILTQAQKEGVPLQPFVSKIEEGLTKQVQPDLIERVLVKKLDDYRLTRSLVDEFTRRHGSERVCFTGVPGTLDREPLLWAFQRGLESRNRARPIHSHSCIGEGG